MCYNENMEFVELSEQEFAKLHFDCGSFLQSVEMYRRYQNLGRESYLLGVREGGKVIAAGLMLVRPWRFGKKIFRIPGGWLLDYDGARATEILQFLTEQSREFCRKKSGIAIEISPNIISQPRDMQNNIVDGKDHLRIKQSLENFGYKYLGEYEQAKWIFTKNLAGETPEKMIMDFRTTHRQLIRKAEREHVRVRELGLDELNILKEIAAEAGERHGFHDPEMEYYRSMKQSFGDKVKFVVAEIPREYVKDLAQDEKRSYIPLAASMFVNDGREMVYLYSGSLRKMQKYNGSYLIQWKMLQEALKSGCQRYNFYGTKPVKGDGVYLFKQGFRGQVEELLGTFALPIGWLGKLYVARLQPQEMREVQ